MKKITYICDNCGKEVEDYREIQVRKIRLDIGSTERFDKFELCPDCFSKLIEPLYKNIKKN